MPFERARKAGRYTRQCAVVCSEARGRGRSCWRAAAQAQRAGRRLASFVSETEQTGRRGRLLDTRKLDVKGET